MLAKIHNSSLIFILPITEEMFKSVIYIGLETISHGINNVVEKLEKSKKTFKL